MIKDLIILGKKEKIDIEVRTNIEEGYTINIFNGIEKKNESYNIKTYYIKAISKGKTVKLNVSSLNNSKEIIGLIKKNINTIDLKDKNVFAKNLDLKKIEFKKEKISISKIYNQLLKLEDLKKEYKFLSNLEIEYSYVYNKVKITNENANLEDEYANHHIFFELVITKNNNNQTGWFNITSKEFDFNKYKNKLIEKIKEAEEKINSESCKTNKYNIVLNNKCVFNLIIKLSELFYAENINKNLSCLSDKFKKKIFSDKITIVEDPENDKFLGRRLFDDEGTKTMYKEIVKNGVFNTKLYDNKNALKDNTNSTGNSFGVRNMYIEKGKYSFDELINKCNSGILIDDIQGLHSGLNKITGEFSLQAQGYIIKNGKLYKPLKLIILSSNIFEIFSNIIEIGNDLEFNSIYGGAPSLLIENISVSGSK